MIVEGLHLEVEGLYLKVEGLYLQVEGLYLQVEGLYLEVEGLYLKVEGLYLEVDGLYLQYRLDGLGALLYDRTTGIKITAHLKESEYRYIAVKLLQAPKET